MQYLLIVGKNRDSMTFAAGQINGLGGVLARLRHRDD